MTMETQIAFASYMPPLLFVESEVWNILLTRPSKNGLLLPLMAISIIFVCHLKPVIQSGNFSYKVLWIVRIARVRRELEGNGDIAVVGVIGDSRR